MTWLPSASTGSGVRPREAGSQPLLTAYRRAWPVFRQTYLYERYCASIPQLRRYPPAFVTRWVQSVIRQSRRELSPTAYITRRVLWVIAGVLAFIVIANRPLTAAFGIPDMSDGIGTWLMMVLAGLGVNATWMNSVAAWHCRQRIRSELASKRLWRCMECDYDLRACTGESCPECGASIVIPTADAEDHAGA